MGRCRWGGAGGADLVQFEADEPHHEGGGRCDRGDDLARYQLALQQTESAGAM